MICFFFGLEYHIAYILYPFVTYLLTLPRINRYYEGNEMKGDVMDGTCSMHVRYRHAYQILVGKPEGETLLGIPICRWNKNGF
jgi:hypothetical protein